MDTRPIGVFDSGVGGVGILSKLCQLLPNEDFIYYGDSAHNPYGTRPQDEIELICKTISRFLALKKVKLIVIACNTATAACLDMLRDYMKDMPFIGVIESGLQSALDVTKNGIITACATKFTADSHVYKMAYEKIKNYSPKQCVVHDIGDSSNLARLIESGWQDEYDKYVEEFVEKIDPKTDTIILACTHYPYIKKVFEKYFHGNVMDPSEKLAENTKKYLIEHNLANDESHQGKDEFYTSGSPFKFAKVASVFMKIDGKEVIKALF